MLPTVIESSFSFPSGHAAIAVALYGFLTYLLLKNMKQEIPRTISICVGILLILAIGFSRLYLGVHFPTDIIGGYLVGGVWLCIGIYLAEYYGRKVTVSLE